MGWPPSALNGVSLWQFYQAAEGWRAANCPPDAPETPTAREHETADWSFG